MGNCCRRRPTNDHGQPDLVGKLFPRSMECDSDGTTESDNPEPSTRRRIKRNNSENEWSEEIEREDYRYSIGHPWYITDDDY